ncbi:MAG: hypothetical protein ACRD04_08160 [Terriglobales bacterium]
MASKTARDHDEIRRWAEARGAAPSVVNRTGGMPRFEFAAEEPESLADVSWEDFFRVFDERGLELVYDDKPGSRVHKLVYPEAVAAKAAGSRARRAVEPARRPGPAKILPIQSKTSTAGKAAKRSSAAQPRTTRTGTKAVGKKPASRRRPRAA